MPIPSWARAVVLATATIAIATIDTASAVPVTTVSVGVPVDKVGSDHKVGTTEKRDLLDGLAIRYFIPLKDYGTGTYGVGSACSHAGYGMCSDSGDGGATLQMVLRFEPTKAGQNTLTIRFEDLDLIGANDPDGFHERLNLFEGDLIKKGKKWKTVLTSLTDPITMMDGRFIGDRDTQILSLPLNLPTTDPLYLVLIFAADSTFKGTNTAEYLLATIAPVEAQATPLPGALVLMGTVLAGCYGVGKLRRRRARRA